MSKVGKTLGVIAVGAAVIGLAAYVAKKVKEIEDFDIDDFDEDEEDEDDESESYEFEDDDIAKEFDNEDDFSTPTEENFGAKVEDTDEVWVDDTEVASEDEESFTADFMDEEKEELSLFKEVCGVSRTEAIEKIISADKEVGYTVSDLEAMSDDALADVYSKTCL